MSRVGLSAMTTSDSQDVQMLGIGMEIETSSCEVGGGDCSLFTFGDFFDSLSAVENKISLYESTRFVKFWKREARTIEVARKQVVQYLNPDLKYYEINISVLMEASSLNLKQKE